MKTCCRFDDACPLLRNIFREFTLDESQYRIYHYLTLLTLTEKLLTCAGFYLELSGTPIRCCTMGRLNRLSDVLPPLRSRFRGLRAMVSNIWSYVGSLVNTLPKVVSFLRFLTQRKLTRRYLAIKEWTLSSFLNMLLKLILFWEKID